MRPVPVLATLLVLAALAAPLSLARSVEVCANYTHEKGGPTYAFNAWASTDDRDGNGVPDHGVRADPTTYPSGLFAVADDLASDQDPHLNGTVNVLAQGDGSKTEVSAARARGTELGCQYAY